MYISAPTLDDILHRVLEKLLHSRSRVTATRGETLERAGVLIQLTNPLARLSHTEKKGKVFSGLGELLWYLSKRNDLDFITYYLRDYKRNSADGHTIYGGYGPRLFAKRVAAGDQGRRHNELIADQQQATDQVSNILQLLTAKPQSRRAVIQLFDAADISDPGRLEVPCTCTLQFLIRARRLHMFTSMRSNDAFLGLPHDVFAFTMLQEILARSLGVNLGVYKHFVGSMHLYAITLA